MTYYHEPTLPTNVYRFEADLTPRDVETMKSLLADARREVVERVMHLEAADLSDQTRTVIPDMWVRLLDVLALLGSSDE